MGATGTDATRSSNSPIVWVPRPERRPYTKTNATRMPGNARHPDGTCIGAPTIRVMTPQIASALAGLPDRPGVYLMKDAQGRVLYVGKAQSLRNRVRQYWQASRSATTPPLRIESAIDRVPRRRVHAHRHGQRGAAARRRTLIKRHQPRFNVRLKDDKSYPFIKVTLGDDFPRIERTRKLPAGRQPLLRPVCLARAAWTRR